MKRHVEFRGKQPLQVLEKAREGSEFTLDDARGGSHYVVLPKCSTNAGRWICITHREEFANQLQKDIHIHDGRHVLAWRCLEHGPEVP